MTPLLTSRQIDFFVAMFAVVGAIFAGVIFAVAIRVITYAAGRAIERHRERRLVALAKKAGWSVIGED